MEKGREPPESRDAMLRGSFDEKWLSTGASQLLKIAIIIFVAEVT